MTKGELHDALDAARESAAYWEKRCRQVEEARDYLLQQVQRRKRQQTLLDYDLTQARNGGEG